MVVLVRMSQQLGHFRQDGGIHCGSHHGRERQGDHEQRRESAGVRIREGREDRVQPHAAHYTKLRSFRKAGDEKKLATCFQGGEQICAEGVEGTERKVEKLVSVVGGELLA